MYKNVAGQAVGVQMITAADGSPFTGSVTVYVTGDNGTQTLGAVASGVCTHEGRGYHSYAPSQAETNYDHVAYTFTAAGAINVTVQVYPLDESFFDDVTSNAITTALAAADLATEAEIAAEVLAVTADVMFQAAFRAPAVVHVNKVTGNDTTGDGTYAAPYATIGKANTIGILPLGGTILIWPGADSGDEYAESTELLDTREVYLMRGVTVQPAAGFCFWIDSQLVSIRGEGILLPPANEPAVRVTDGHPDIFGVAIHLNNAGSLAVQSNNAAAIILKEVHIEGQVAVGSNPAAFFESETIEPAHISINNSTIVYDSSGRKSLTIGYGYPGLWDTATHVGSVGLVAAGISTGAITAAKFAAAAITSTVAPNLDAAVSTRATPAQVATELGTYDAPTKAEMDAAVALLATNAQLVKVLAAVYDTATVAGDVITLSNAATQTITAGGRTTA